jgi:hypothetical protein
VAEKQDTQKTEKIMTFPHLVTREVICALIVIGVLSLFSIYFDAPLEDPPSATRMPSPTKAPWYFLGLQELLVYFDPWMAGVVIPLLIMLGLMVIPYVDFNKEGVGKFDYSKRKLAITFFTAGTILWFLLIIIGEFFRGPSWVWYWPWESWELHKALPPATINLPPVVGFFLLALYFGTGFILPIKFNRTFYQKLGLVKYFIVINFILVAFGVVVKILLRLLFNIKYVLQTPWFNI